MNAQEMMINYAKNKMNSTSTLTPEQWCGKMIAEGIRCNDGVIARAKREGKIIVITETTREEKPLVKNGRCEIVTEETTIEVMRISL
jgi:hypothetical protein